jgi:transposase-like protein
MLSMNKPVRWTLVRKIELLNEIRTGQLSPAEALVQFDIESEELSRWRELFRLGGHGALMAGQVQKYRQKAGS